MSVFPSQLFVLFLLTCSFPFTFMTCCCIKHASFNFCYVLVTDFSFFLHIGWLLYSLLDGQFRKRTRMRFVNSVKYKSFLLSLFLNTRETTEWDWNRLTLGRAKCDLLRLMTVKEGWDVVHVPLAHLLQTLKTNVLLVLCSFSDHRSQF